MAIEFDIPEPISYLFKYIDGVYYAFASSNIHDIDYFDDIIHEGDMLCFLNHGYPAAEGHFHRFSGLVFDIVTPVDADYEFKWEYYSSSGWKDLPNVVDNTDGLRIAGQNTITWDMPNDWITINRACNNNYYSSGYIVRLRVVTVNSSIEGGMQGSDLIKAFNYGVTIRDGNAYSLEDIYQASISNGWNIVEKYGYAGYILKSNLVINNGSLAIDTGELLQVGEQDRFMDLNLTSNGILYIHGGRLELMTNTIYGTYNIVSGKFKMDTGASFRKYTGGYVSLSFSGRIEIEDASIDSQYSSDTIMFSGNTNGFIKRVNWAIPYFFIYTNNLETSDIKFGEITTQAQHILSGSSRFNSLVFNSDLTPLQDITVTQGAELYLVNCNFLNNQVLVSSYTYNSYSNYVWRMFVVKIRVIDEEGLPVSGAKVYIHDKNGHTALQRNWYETDGYYLDDITSPTDNTGRIMPNKPEWFDVDKIFRFRGEYFKVLSVSGNTFSMDRGLTYKDYESLGIGRIYRSNLIEELDFIETDINGEAKFHGNSGSFWPKIYTDVWSKSWDGSEHNRLDLNPYTICIEKQGYIPFQVSLEINKELELLVILQKEPAFGLLDFNKTIKPLPNSKKFYISL